MPKSIPVMPMTYLPVGNAQLAKMLLQLGTDIAQRQLVASTANGGGLTIEVNHGAQQIWDGPELIGTEPVGKILTLSSNLQFVPCAEKPPSPAELLKILPTRAVLTALLDHCGLVMCGTSAGEIYLKKTANTPSNTGMFSQDVLLAAIAGFISNG